jgi:isopentenyl diphosphate isomerase/L-lactate dehydrogenase-like FMN-dependent dehydrogenase
MEKTITRVVKKSLDIKYPFFDDVEVTKEKNHRSYFTDEKKNYNYNVFLSIDNEKLQQLNKSVDWETLKDFIRDIVKMCGINNRIDVYMS